MSGGGKKGGQKVYDFLMSIDYGMCHGPVDSINQVWVKEKPIWCGSETERVDVAVDLPDLYGGDEAEGGVDGTVEFYLGSDDQLSSTALASRVNRTPETMPGYRGLCHLFFRGKGNNGFRWTTNNPYLPPVEASVTRLPDGLGNGYERIYGMVAELDEFGQPTGGVVERTEAGSDLTGDVSEYDAGAFEWYQTGFEDPEYTYIDMTSFATAEQIDAGDLSYLAQWTFELHSSFGPANEDGTAQMRGRWYGSMDDATNDVNRIAPTDLGTSEDLLSTFTYFDVSISDVAPVGARVLRIKAEVAIGLALFTSVVAESDMRETTVFVRERVTTPSHCLVPGADEVAGALGSLPDANPAEIIYECLVNEEWGKGEVPSNIDLGSFEQAALTLHAEFFGLSIIWVRQTEIESFVQEILDHIQAMLFIKPTTGLWTLKLLRDDYDLTGLTPFSPSNCKVKKRKRKAWGETVNEIVVSYTDPQTEKAATVSSHNLANISIQGGLISETRDYYGVRNAILAKKLADRDVIASGYPLFTCVIEADRTAWDVFPGDVQLLQWPEDGIESMAVRVMSVDYGGPKDRKIRLEVIEDVFAFDKTEYVAPQSSSWSDPGNVEAVSFTAELAMTPPAPLGLREGLTPEELDAENPAIVGVLLLGTHDTITMFDFEAHTDVVLPNSATEVQAVATAPPTRSHVIEEAWVRETETTLAGAVTDDLFQGSAETGNILMLGLSEDLHELVMLDTYTEGADTWTVVRGVWDTVPLDWDVGSRLWVFPSSTILADMTERVAGQAVTYRYLTRTPNGRMSYDDALDVDITLSERPYLPFRPGNTQLAGFGFEGYFTNGTVPVTVTADWVNRNRLTEDAIVLSWDDATVTPETDQVTRLNVYDSDDVLLTTHDDLTGETFDIPIASFGGEEFGYVEFLSKNTDGDLSRTGAKIAFDFRYDGYGFDYGNDYGTSRGYGADYGESYGTDD